VLGGPADGLTADRVSGQRAVAVGERVGGDDERWVRDDQIERLAGDRVEQAPFTQIKLDSVQPRREAGELERARVDVGSNNALRESRG
jgi:hypothetical protein